MNNEKRELVIIRSRFQPFTKFHSDIVRQLIDSGTDVALCVIRDYETISRFHRMLPEVKDIDLRHLPLFNPLTTWDVILCINRSLEKSSVKKNVPMIFSPLKFSELVEVLTSSLNDLVIPPDINKFIEEAHPCDNTNFKRCKIKEQLGKIISIIAYDSFPKEIRWLFPIFDLEDEKDAQQAEQNFFGKIIRVKVSNSPIFQLVFQRGRFEKPLTPPLGLYGMFCLWIYLSFIKKFVDPAPQYPWKPKYRFNIPQEMQDIAWLSTQVDKLESELKKCFLDDNEWQFYKNRASEELSDLLKGFENVPEVERNMLLNYYDFIRLANTSIKAVDSK